MFITQQHRAITFSPSGILIPHLKTATAKTVAEFFGVLGARQKEKAGFGPAFFLGRSVKVA
jgi:hypothetical protein